MRLFVFLFLFQLLLFLLSVDGKSITLKVYRENFCAAALRTLATNQDTSDQVSTISRYTLNSIRSLVAQLQRNQHHPANNSSGYAHFTSTKRLDGPLSISTVLSRLSAVLREGEQKLDELQKVEHKLGFQASQDVRPNVEQATLSLIESGLSNGTLPPILITLSEIKNIEIFLQQLINASDTIFKSQKALFLPQMAMVAFLATEYIGIALHTVEYPTVRSLNLDLIVFWLFNGIEGMKNVSPFYNTVGDNLNKFQDHFTKLTHRHLDEREYFLFSNSAPIQSEEIATLLLRTITPDLELDAPIRQTSVFLERLPLWPIHRFLRRQWVHLDFLIERSPQPKSRMELHLLVHFTKNRQIRN